MLHGDTVATLRAWEERFPVLSWSIGGLHVWPLIRIHLSSELLAVGEPKAPRPAWRFPHHLRQSMRSIAALVKHRRSTLLTLGPVDALFLSRPANRQRVGDVWYDRFFDPITDILDTQGHSSLHIECRPYGTHYLTPRYRPSLVMRGAVTRCYVAAALRSLQGADLEGFDAFARDVRRTHPAISGISRLSITRQACMVEMLARYFDRVLRRARPHVAFCSVYYSRVGMAFCLAARRLGIPAIDVQHGATVGNPAYEGWSRFPDGGFALLPARFWCWSDVDARPVRAWPEAARRHHHAIVGGHPWLALWRAGHPLATAFLARIPDRRAGSLTVLATLTWSSGLSDLLKQVLTDSPANWNWWLRLHPLMDRDRAALRSWCDRHVPGRVQVDSATDLPLPLLLEAADVHLTHNSTVVQEAAQLGTPSVVIDRRARDVYTEELESGWAVFADETAAILAALAAQHRRRESLRLPPPYPSWTEIANVVNDLVAEPLSCPATAFAASSPTPARV